MRQGCEHMALTLFPANSQGNYSRPDSRKEAAQCGRRPRLEQLTPPAEKYQFFLLSLS